MRYKSFEDPNFDTHQKHQNAETRTGLYSACLRRIRKILETNYKRHEIIQCYILDHT